MKKLNVLILAAGEGTRIGTPKWRLKWEGERFIDILFNHLEEANLADIYTLMSEEEAPQFIRNYPNRKVLINPDPSLGMISSIKIGVEQTPPADSYLIVLVDHPFVKTATYETLVNSFKKYAGYLIQPVVNTKPGHPVIVPHQVFDKGFPEDLANSNLHMMIVKSNIPVMKVAVKDEEIFRNVNVPADLRRD